jgi:hypothetical protein
VALSARLCGRSRCSPAGGARRSVFDRSSCQPFRRCQQSNVGHCAARRWRLGQHLSRDERRTRHERHCRRRLDSLHYFWKARTPEETANDIARTIEHYTAAWSRQRVILIGYSLGADVLPSIVNRLPSDVREHICSIALVGLGDTTIFEVQIKHWLPGAKLDGQPVAPELGNGHHLGGQYREIAHRIVAASRC